MTFHSYPAQLAEFVRQAWLELDDREGAHTVLGGALPSGPTMTKLLSIAYQATLLREEERPVTFRLVLGDPDAFPAENGPPDGLHRLVFDAPRPFSEHELRRLSPAAKYHRSLIGVQRDEDDKLSIWGILHSGPRWLQASNGGRGVSRQIATGALIVRATGPGRLAVARGADTIGELRAGLLSSREMDVFRSKWLSLRFKAAREEIRCYHDEQRAKGGAGWGTLDEALPARISKEMMKRMIASIRSSHHGGTILVLPPEDVAEVTQDPQVLRVKYAFRDEEPRYRYRALMLRTLAWIANAAGTTNGATVGWDFYESAQSQELSALDESIFEMSHLIAGLADVDGAVVLTTGFELLGFGAEIGALPEVRTVRRALDVEGREWLLEPVEGVGTRHRSAYRLCQRFRRAVAVVVSQDGNVRFIAFHEGAVTYWDHVSPGWVG